MIKLRTIVSLTETAAKTGNAARKELEKAKAELEKMEAAKKSDKKEWRGQLIDKAIDYKKKQIKFWADQSTQTPEKKTHRKPDDFKVIKPYD